MKIRAFDDQTRSSHLIDVSPLVRIAPSGWFTSWAIEAVNSPSIETRAA